VRREGRREREREVSERENERAVVKCCESFMLQWSTIQCKEGGINGDEKQSNRRNRIAVE
jgi:hypothetical protein